LLTHVTFGWDYNQPLPLLPSLTHLTGTNYNQLLSLSPNVLELKLIKN